MTVLRDFCRPVAGTWELGDRTWGKSNPIVSLYWEPAAVPVLPAVPSERQLAAPRRWYRAVDSGMRC